MAGKGEALWKSQFVTRGDLVVFVDADNKPVELTADAAHVPDGYGLVTGRV